ncbi:hypothetical protein RFI_25089, partial [Reticulomyxa filosa]
ERKSNSLRDFIHAAIEMDVTHLLTLSQHDVVGTVLRMVRLPEGPTFWFRVKEYSTLSDVISLRKKPLHYQFSLQFPPLVVLNGFSSVSTTTTTTAPEQSTNEDTTQNPNKEKKEGNDDDDNDEDGDGDNENKNEKDNDNDNNNNNNNNNNNDDNDNEKEKEISERIRIRPNQVHLKLVAAMLKHMFPAMNVAAMRLKHCKRVVFFQYNNESNTIDMRHYKISVVPVGVSRSVRRLIQDDRSIPDLHRFKDVSEYVLPDPNSPQMAGAMSSDSEMEDNEHTRVKLSQDVFGHGNTKSQSSAIRLREIGPRLVLELTKIEELINTGRVLYHAFIQKTREEIMELETKKQKEVQVKTQRKKQQEANVRKKLVEKAEQKVLKKDKQKEVKLTHFLKEFPASDNAESTAQIDDPSHPSSSSSSKTPLPAKHKINFTDSSSPPSKKPKRNK